MESTSTLLAVDPTSENPYSQARVIVIGASGFIGRWVARALTARGAELSLVVRDAPAAEKIFDRYGVRGTIYQLDLRDVEATRRLITEARPSITFNLAGYGVDRTEVDEDDSYHINMRLVATICDAVRKTRDLQWSGQDVVHVGSALEYGKISGNLHEDARPNPTTLYGKSKLAGTLCLARSATRVGVKALTARLFTVYGPGEHEGRLLPSLLLAGRTGRPVALTAGRQRRDFTYVVDVAYGLLRLATTETAPGHIVNLATGRLISVRSFAECAAKTLEFTTDQLRFGDIPIGNDEMAHAEVAIERLRRLIGWVPETAISDGIRETYQFGQEHGFTDD